MSTRFSYQARTTSGSSQRGSMAASDRSDAIRRLRMRGLTPTTLKAETSSSKASTALSDKSARDLSRTLAQLLRAGLSFAQALKFASEELTAQPAMVAARMREVAEAGEPPSSALDEFSGAQARLLKGVVLAGETSGRLGDALEVAASSFQRSTELRGRVGTALIYPSFVILATLATLGCFLFLVVPTLGEAFSGAEDKLPASTRTLMHLSAWLQTNGAIAALSIAAIVGLIWITPAAREAISRTTDAALSSPIGFGITQRLEFSAFASLAALSLAAGVPSGSAFDAAASGVRNSKIRAQLERAIATIRIGERPSVALERAASPPKSFLRLMHVGEETGKLADALNQASTLLAAEAEQRLERMGAIAGPIITLGLGSIVASVVMSLFLGLLAMSDMATA